MQPFFVRRDDGRPFAVAGIGPGPGNGAPRREVRGPSKRVRVAVQPRPEDVDGDAGHAPSEDRHKRSHLGHDLRVPVPSRLEGGRGDMGPGCRAADSGTRKETIGHGKDRRRHGKLIPEPLSFGGGPWGFRFRSSEALSTSREARTRPGEEPPRTWNVGSDDGRASLGVVGSLFEVARRSSQVVESSNEDLGRADGVVERRFRRRGKNDSRRGELGLGPGKFVRRRGSSIPGRGKLGRGPRREGVARMPPGPSWRALISSRSATFVSFSGCAKHVFRAHQSRLRDRASRAASPRACHGRSV